MQHRAAAARGDGKRTVVCGGEDLAEFGGVSGAGYGGGRDAVDGVGV